MGISIRAFPDAVDADDELWRNNDEWVLGRMDICLYDDPPTIAAIGL